MWLVPPGAKQLRADRLGGHMSWQLLDEMPEWEPETDKLLHVLPIAGCVFRKTYFDPGKGRNVSLMVDPRLVVINYHAKSLELVPRISEEIRYYPLEIEEMVRAGTFRAPPSGKYSVDMSGAGTQGPIDSQSPQNADDHDAPIEFVEQHRWWDLDQDGYPEPIIVTFHKSSGFVARIVARYDADGVHVNLRTGEVTKINPVHFYTKYDFIPNPDGGIYGLGFGQLLRPINEAVNSSVNMLIDAGHLQNAGGGFIGKGLSMNTGSVRFTLGEYKQVNVTGSVLRDSIVPFPAPGPSPVLFQLLGLMIEAGKEISAVKDVLTGDQQQHNVPATTTLALIEQGLKTFTAIYKRVHLALKQELAKLYRLNRVYMNDQAHYKVGNEWRSITRQDYEAGSSVEPVSDPTMVSDMQKLGRAQFLMGFSNHPFCDGMEIRRRVLDAASIDNPSAILRGPPPPNPLLVEKALNLEIKGNREKAAELKDLAQAILFFAQADKAVGDAHVGWIQQQLELFKTQVEALGNGPQGQQGAPGAPMPMQGISPPMMSSPPIQGARQAPDGHFYLPDPARPGKYLRVLH
jgi:chaperonin GroES